MISCLAPYMPEHVFPRRRCFAHTTRRAHEWRGNAWRPLPDIGFAGARTFDTAQKLMTNAVRLIRMAEVSRVHRTSGHRVVTSAIHPSRQPQPAGAPKPRPERHRYRPGSPQLNAGVRLTKSMRAHIHFLYSAPASLLRRLSGAPKAQRRPLLCAARIAHLNWLGPLWIRRACPLGRVRGA
jgi:hypothetical protein